MTDGKAGPGWMFRWAYERGLYYLDDADEPVRCRSAQDISKSREQRHADRFVVCLDVIRGVEVSTVFLGMEHGAPDEGVLWETMIFGGPYDMRTWRYTSREQAKVAHRRIADRLQAGLAPYSESEGEP